jgi:hypothetical protein
MEGRRGPTETQESQTTKKAYAYFQKKEIDVGRIRGLLESEEVCCSEKRAITTGFSHLHNTA